MTGIFQFYELSRSGVTFIHYSIFTVKRSLFSMSLVPVTPSSAFALRYLPLCRALIGVVLTRLALFGVVLIGAVSADAADANQDDQWSRFHGKDGIGYCASGTIPDSWTDSDYRWRYKTGARDVGSPVVIAGKVFLLLSLIHI